MSKSEISKGEGESDAGGAGGWAPPSGSCLQLVLGKPTPEFLLLLLGRGRGDQGTTGGKRRRRLQGHTSHRHADPEDHRRRLLRKQENPGSSPNLYGCHGDSDRDVRVLVVFQFVDGSPGWPDSHKPGPLFPQGWTTVLASFRCGHETSWCHGTGGDDVMMAEVEAAPCPSPHWLNAKTPEGRGQNHGPPAGQEFNPKTMTFNQSLTVRGHLRRPGTSAQNTPDEHLPGTGQDARRPRRGRIPRTPARTAVRARL